MTGSSDESTPSREEVAATLASLRSAARQRQGELAAASDGGEELGRSLAELRRHEFVQEPRPVSPRPGIGRLIVTLRKAAYHLFFKWWGRAVLQQQNEFNQAAAALLAAAVEREEENRRELRRLRARLDAAAGAADRSGDPG